MIDATIIDLMLLVTAVDDKIWHIQEELDSTDEDDPMYGYNEEEQARYMTLAAKLKRSYLEAAAADPTLQDYATLIRPGMPGR